MSAEVAENEGAGIVGNKGIVVEVGVVENKRHFYAASLYGLKREYRMVDGSQRAVYHKNERKPTRGHVVGCKEIIGEGHHKAASALYKDDLKSLEQPPCGAIDYFERNIATVEAGGELRRAGVAEYQRSGGMVEVDIHRLHAHNAAVKLDILGKILIAGLDKLLRNDILPDGHQCGGEPAGAVAFTGIGMDTADEI